MNDIDKPIARVLEAYAAAVLAKDAGAMMRLYVADVQVFDAWGVWSHAGSAAWRTAVEGWFTSLGNERVKVGFQEVQASVGRELAMVFAIVTYQAVSPAGEVLRSMQNRLTWGLRMSGHAWRIIHEHTSAPVGFDDMKAILTKAG